MYFRAIDHYHNDQDNDIINNNNDNNDNNDNNNNDNNNNYNNNNDDNDTDNINLIECFVCYESRNGNESPIKLRNQIYYTKNCYCDGFIHKKCLDKWFNKNKSCPICRNNICENVTLTVSIINNKSFSHALFAFILLKKNIKAIVNYSSFLFFVIFLIEFYLSIIDKSHFLENSLNV